VLRCGPVRVALGVDFLHTHFHLNTNLIRRTSGHSVTTLNKAVSDLTDIGEVSTEKHFPIVCDSDV
jgi:hypothetical protein